MDDSRLYRLAREAGAWFEVALRAGEGDEGARRFVRTREGCPEWVRDLVHAAHGDMLPDDWRYQTIRDALDWIGENEPDDVDDGWEFADSAVDVYTSERYAWLSSHLSRAGYVDEATAEFGPADDVVDAIGRGQYLEACEVYGAVVEALRERAEEVDDDEDDDDPSDPDSGEGDTSTPEDARFAERIAADDAADEEVGA